MLENIPAPDNLHDKEGRVPDIDAAHEMASLENRYRSNDAGKFFKPRKKELAEREARIEEIGRKILAEKQADREDRRALELKQEALLGEKFISRHLQQNGISREAWLAFSPDQRRLLSRGWRRTDERSPEWRLEQRLKTLIGRKMTSFDVGDFGDIQLVFEDGSVLSFDSYDGYNDRPGYDEVEVRRSDV